eukprot:5663293-Lingulodinium_polyedra.AAC.1
MEASVKLQRYDPLGQLEERLLTAPQPTEKLLLAGLAVAHMRDAGVIVARELHADHLRDVVMDVPLGGLHVVPVQEVPAIGHVHDPDRREALGRASLGDRSMAAKDLHDVRTLLVGLK